MCWGRGLLGAIFDGIERPLNRIMEQSGAFIDRGVRVDSIDREKEWDVKVLARPGDAVQDGGIVAEVQETAQIVRTRLWCRTGCPAPWEGAAGREIYG